MTFIPQKIDPEAIIAGLKREEKEQAQRTTRELKQALAKIETLEDQLELEQLTDKERIRILEQKVASLLASNAEYSSFMAFHTPMR